MTNNKTDKIELEAQKREILGSAVSKLRKEGLIPAILYGKNQEAIPLQIVEKDFHKVLKAAGESSLVYLNVDGKSYPTIIHDVSLDAVKDTVLHADFYKVRLDEKIKAMVPVVFEGESAAVRDLGGIFVRNVNELEVEAFPQDLPHEIKVDISPLNNFGEQILVKDINLGTAVKLIADENEIVGTVQEPISEEELKKELEEITTVEEIEEIGKEKKEEGTAEEIEPGPAVKEGTPSQPEKK